jgi:serine/threonine-protein kinase
MVGRVLGNRFTILGRIGAGSMGTVYRARQAPFDRDIAIKILRSDRAIDEVSRNRFSREARANSLLTSPNTVTVFDFGQSDTGDFFLAMELLEGESLGQRLKRLGRLSPDCAIDTALQALHSIAEAHAKGIIHRDLKPDNLFYARVRTNEMYEEIVKVLDFGIAKLLHAPDPPGVSAVETQAGTVFGTPRYMSPEQAQGKLLDARSDLYSLGVILYHMLAGRPPFTDDDAIVVMARHIKTAPRPLSEVARDANIPPELEEVVMRVLSKNPDRRPQSAEAMMNEIARTREVPVIASGIRSAPRIDGILDPPPSVPSPASSPPERWPDRSGNLGSRWPLAKFGGAVLAAFALAFVLAFGLAEFRMLRTRSGALQAPRREEAPMSTNLSPALTDPASVPLPSGLSSVSAGGRPVPEPQPAPALRVDGRRPRAVRSGVSSPKPQGSAAVGYGYLE